MSETPIARRVLECMRRQVRSKVVDLAAFREGNEFAAALQNSAVPPETLREMHPAHAIYAHVFEGYVNHQPGAIFLEGLPDVPESRPHSPEYVRHAKGH
jgi:hypothetical protein